MRLELKDLGNGKTHWISDQGAFIGRENSDIVINDANVAPRHARLYAENGRFFLEDLKSGGGVFVHAKRITERFELSISACFAIAGHRFEVTTLEGAAASPSLADPPANPPAEGSLESIVLEPVEGATPMVELAAPTVPAAAVVESTPTPTPAADPDHNPFQDLDASPAGDAPQVSRSIWDATVAQLQALTDRPDWPRLRWVIAGTGGALLLVVFLMAIWPNRSPHSPAEAAAPVAVAPAPASMPAAAPSAEADEEPERKETPYQAFLRKRDELEQVLEEDPVLLKRVAGALELYERIHEETARLEKRKRDRKKRARAVDERLREAEIFERLAPLVDELHRKLADARKR